MLLEPVDVRDRRADIARAHRRRGLGRSRCRHRRRRVRIGASVGIAISQDGVTDADRLLARGRHRRLPGEDVRPRPGRGLRRVAAARTAERAELEAALDRARSSTTSSLLHYQPIVDWRPATIRGYEALVRWQRPGTGLVRPAEFIPTAEASNLICEIDAWVLRRGAAGNSRTGPGAAAIGAHDGGEHLRPAHQRTADRRRRRDARWPSPGSTPHQLVIEITETVLIDEPARDRAPAASCASWASRSASTTSAPATTRSPDCSTCRSTCIKIDRSFLDTHPLVAGAARR